MDTHLLSLIDTFIQKYDNSAYKGNNPVNEKHRFHLHPEDRALVNYVKQKLATNEHNKEYWRHHLTELMYLDTRTNQF